MFEAIADARSISWLVTALLGMVVWSVRLESVVKSNKRDIEQVRAKIEHDLEETNKKLARLSNEDWEQRLVLEQLKIAQGQHHKTLSDISRTIIKVQ